MNWSNVSFTFSNRGTPLLLVLLALGGCDPEKDCRRALEDAPRCEDGCPSQEELTANLAGLACDEAARSSCTTLEGDTYTVLREGNYRHYFVDGQLTGVENRRGDEDVCAQTGNQWFGTPVFNCVGDTVQARAGLPRRRFRRHR